MDTSFFRKGKDEVPLNSLKKNQRYQNLRHVVNTIDNEQNEDVDEELDELENYINSELQKIEATEVANQEISRSGVNFEINNDREKVVSIVNKYINN